MTPSDERLMNALSPLQTLGGYDSKQFAEVFIIAATTGKKSTAGLLYALADKLAVDGTVD